MVEVFPPLFTIRGTKEDINLGSKLEELVGQVREIRKYADLILVATVKNPDLLKVSSIITAAFIQKNTGIEAAPSIVVRDSNRLQLLSEIVTAYSLGLKSVLLVWGDRYPAGANSKNAYDFRSLSEVIREAVRIASRAGIKPRILAPVTIGSTGRTAPARLGAERVKAGASLLLGQPPTTDPKETFDRHAVALGSAGLKGSVLLNVFPFRDRKDVVNCEKYFGWKLPRRLHDTAGGGKSALVLEARGVVERLRSEDFPGVYVSTRRDPTVVKDVLG